jgi:hypothetical protein
MRYFQISLIATCAAQSVAAWSTWSKPGNLPPVSSEALQALITVDDLKHGLGQLQSFADANGGTRVMGSQGHNETINFLYETLLATGYYDVYLQEQTQLFSGTSKPVSLVTNGETQAAEFFTYGSGGTVDAPLVQVDGLGCDVADFPPEAADAVVLIKRGNCTFALKAANALEAGAAGAVIYDNVAGLISGGTMSEPGDYAPAVSISQAAGEALVALLEAGTAVSAQLEIDAVNNNVTTYNVIA